MVIDKKNFTLTLGQTRKNSLDSASFCLAEGHLSKAELYISNFLTTINDDDGQIQRDFDVFYKDSLKELSDLNKRLHAMIQSMKINQWQPQEMRQDGETRIFAKELGKRFEYVWNLSIKDGLFNAK